jgi:hypothetical protein
MDRQNDEFEGFLRQFHLRTPGPLPEPPSVRSRLNGRWLLAGAAAVSAILVAAALLWNSAGPSRPFATVEAAGDSMYRNGEKVGAGRTVQSGPAEGMIIALEDGTRVEIRSVSELLWESAADGVRIRLNSGSVIVNAVSQRSGHLYVETRHVVASVVGTVFHVHAEQGGTRVDVIEGEVRVQQGQTSKTLAPGDHISTDSLLESQSIAAEIAWSRHAGAHLALLEQSVPVWAAPTVGANQEPRRGVSPIRVEPIVVAPINVAPINVQPITPPRQNPIPDSPGRDILERACSACHAVDTVTGRRFSSRGEIEEVINREIRRGASLSDREFPILVEYLSANNRQKKKGAK